MVIDVVPYGRPARQALLAAIADLRAGDVLAPVTVVVPSALAGTTLRRALAEELGGLLAVSFESLPALAARLGTPALAAAGRPPIDGLTARAVTGGVLAAEPGPFAAVADHPATVAAVVDTLAELRPLHDAELGALAGSSARGAAVVRLHRAVCRRTERWSDDHDVLVAAGAALRDPRVLDELGTMVLHLPRRLRRSELELLAPVAAAGRLRAVIGITGRQEADEVATELVAQLAGLGLSERGSGRPAAVLDPATTEVVSAPDPAEEVRHAVRLIRHAIAAGTAPERIALVARVAEPYLLLAHEELHAAGIDHSAPSPGRLAQSMAGRTLLALLRWQQDGARRDALMRVLRAAPVLDADGHRARAGRWDRIAREAGVVAGLDQWRTRLAAAAAEREREIRQHSGDPAADERLAELASLRSFVEHVAGLTDATGLSGWRALGPWAAGVLRSGLGPDAATRWWPEEEQVARRQVLDLLARLASLPEDPTITSDRFLRVLDHELQRGGARTGRFGHGVTVARLVDVVGADLDLLAVVGAAEGAFPPGRPDDSVLPARDRRAVGALRLRGSSRSEEERDAWAALLSAERRVLTHPRADPRNQREQHPAPWLLEVEGTRTRLASFEHWLADSGAPATPLERDVAELVVAHRAGLDVATTAAVRANHLERAVAAARSRAAGGFDEWSGFVGPHELLSGELAQHRSPTGLEMWAKCPFQYFLGKVLGVRALDDPATVETITGRDRGSLVHEVLERFMRARLGADLRLRWDDEAKAELGRIADEVEGRYRDQGRTGRPLLWRPEWRTLRRHLERIVEHGLLASELAGMVPVAVEHAFGYEGDDHPAVEVDLGDGRPLRFGGRIDRVDATPDGRRAVVVDYKTAKSDDYKALAEDIVDRGTRLQLPIYALAARRIVPEAEQVAAFYWFVSPQGKLEMKGGVIDAEADARFRDVLGTVVHGIEGGAFPARPGKEDWRPGAGETYAACRWCDFDRICPTARGERWERVRVHGALARYVALAEGELAAPEPGEAAPP